MHCIVGETAGWSVAYGYVQLFYLRMFFLHYLTTKPHRNRNY